MKLNPLFLFGCILSVYMSSCCGSEGKGDVLFRDAQNVSSFLVEERTSANFTTYKGITQSFDHVFLKNDPMDDESCNSCCRPLQRKMVVYDGSANSYNFVLSVNAKVGFGDDELSISYVPKYTLNLLYHNEDVVYIEGQSLANVMENKNSYTEYYDSLSIENRMFYKVYKFKKEVNTTKLYPKEIYYTITEGLVAYQMSDSTMYKLIN